jgi:hypothetical protein
MRALAALASQFESSIVPALVDPSVRESERRRFAAFHRRLNGKGGTLGAGSA